MDTHTPSLASQSLFWSQLFSGPTPPESLGLALKEGIVPQHLLAEHGEEWLEAWVSGLAERMQTARDPMHTPWRRAHGIGSYSRWQMDPQEMSPRLDKMDPGHPDAGILSVFQGFHSRGINPFGPFKTLKHLGGNGLAACVALNLPSAIDWLSTLPHGPAPEELAAMQTPQPVHKERTALPWLHAAALGWQDTLLQSLLDYGIDPNICDRKGQTALFYARTPTAVRALLAAGADPQAKDKHQNTALMAWEVAREESFVANLGLKTLQETLGEAGASEALDSSRAVLHVTSGPTHPEGLDQWVDNFPKLPGNLYEARMDPGGGWRGNWSPASWLGLQVLRGEVFPYDFHVPHLLGRDDFISPDDYSPRGKLTEHGLLGLALASLSKDVGYGNQSSRQTRQSVWEAFGKEWFWTEKWQAPAQATSAYLLGLKSTSMRVREAIEKAWLSELWRMDDDEVRATKAWELRTMGAVRFEDSQWLDMIDKAPGPLTPLYGIVCLADAAEKDRQEHKGNPSSPHFVIAYGAGNAAWKHLERYFGGGGEFDIQACPASLKPLVDETIEWMIESGEDLSKMTPLLERGMKQALPEPSPQSPKAKGRL